MSEVLGGRYELGASLGAGGMGRVVVARDRVLDRTVAVKLVPVEQARSADPALAARFVAEARTVARFAHRHVVGIYDAGESDGYLYIVTEFVDGTTLAHRLGERGRIGVEESMRIGAQLLDALAAAHAAGIVHRDVKPSNVLLDADGNVKLADFGIAKRLDDLEAALTATGEFVGTPRYVAPEQAAGQRATPATDLYAVGVVIFEMLAGHAPFDAETPMATLLAHRDAPVPDVRHARPEVPAALATAIATAMAKRPEDRFASAGEMRIAITSASTSTSADPTLVAGAVSVAAAGATAVYPSPDPSLAPPVGASSSHPGDVGLMTQDPGRRSPNAHWWWAAVAALVAVGIVAIIAAGGSDDPGGADTDAGTSRPGGAPAAAAAASTDVPSAPPPSAPPATTATPATAPSTAPPSTATPPTAPPSTGPPSTPPPTPPPTAAPTTQVVTVPAGEPAPTVPELPGELDALVDVVAADPAAFGVRGQELLSALELVVDERGRRQREAAGSAIEQLNTWTEAGEIDAATAQTIQTMLGEYADGNGDGNGDDNGNGNGGNGGNGNGGDGGDDDGGDD